MNRLNIQIAHTSVVTVTYGNRYRFLQQVVAGAFSNGASKVIIVDNGSTVTSKQAIETLERNSNGQIAVVKLPENCGSASGFKAGLEYALSCSDCEYIWLLDDDNRPEEGALAELFRQQGKLSQLIPADQLALVSARQNWDSHKNLIQGIPPSRFFPAKSSFMNFHLLRQPRKILEMFHLDRVTKRDLTATSPIEIPLAPYGGLFFHKNLLSTIGYPDERFFLYHDDSEYTYRLTERGGKVFLVPLSIILDLERSWHLPRRGETLFSRLLIAESDFRCFYATRNQAYLDRNLWTKSLTAYTLNKWAFFGTLFLFALRYGRWKRLAMIIRAARQGELGELGRLKDLEN
jgi:GT2 family glycosyltransferase